MTRISICLHSSLYTATHCNSLQRNATHYNTLQSRISICCLYDCVCMHVSVCVCLYARREACPSACTTVSTLQLIAYYSTLQHTAPHCNTLQHTATHCNTLQYTAITRVCIPFCKSDGNILHHTATHCNTLQQTVTHCNTL